MREIDDISDAFWECILTECGESAVGFFFSHFSFDCLMEKPRLGTTLYKKVKTNRDWVQILHFYHAKTVNIDMRRIHVPNTNLGRHERN